jgi:hypothetical protein
VEDRSLIYTLARYVVQHTLMCGNDFTYQDAVRAASFDLSQDPALEFP